MDQKIRSLVLSYDKYRCRVCRSESNLEIHHIAKMSDGGSDDFDNLITLCGGCHRIQHLNQEYVLEGQRGPAICFMPRHATLRQGFVLDHVLNCFGPGNPVALSHLETVYSLKFYDSNVRNELRKLRRRRVDERGGELGMLLVSLDGVDREGRPIVGRGIYVMTEAGKNFTLDLRQLWQKNKESQLVLRLS